MICDMPVAKQISFRRALTKYPVVAAFGISLLIHSGLYVGWRLGKHLGLWQYKMTFLQKLLPSQNSLPRLVEIKKLTPPQERRQVPMTFVEIDPAQAAAEPPKDTKYYSTVSTVAANPDPRLETEVPKFDGEQEKMVRTLDNPKPQLHPLQPSRPKENPPPEPVEAAPKPKVSEPKGDIELAKITPVEVKAGEKNDDAKEIEPTKPTHVRPRTIAAALQQNPALVGKKMKQEGGVRRAHLNSSLDVKASPFGDYDSAFISGVQQRWYDLLEEHGFALHTGKVVLDFRLTYDGRITDMKVNDNTVGELLGWTCQKAVQDPAPFGKWPSDMRKMVGADFREVRFTFYYD